MTFAECRRLLATDDLIDQGDKPDRDGSDRYHDDEADDQGGTDSDEDDERSS